MRFGEFLRERGLLGDADIERVLAMQNRTNLWLGTLAYILGYLEFDQIGEVLDEQRRLGLRFGEAAISLNLMTTEQVRQVVELQERKRVRFGEIAVAMEYVDRASLGALLEEYNAGPPAGVAAT